MNNFKIEIEVNFGQSTIDALHQIFGPRVQSPEITTEKLMEQMPPKPAMETKSETPAPQTEPAPVADDDDLPLSDAEKAAEEAKAAPAPSEADMRAAIQATRKRGVPAKTIREYIKSTFGVETSVECPENRRQELIDGLAKLAA